MAVDDAELRRLKEENEQLRTAVARAEAPKRQLWRAIVAVVVLVLAGLLVPTSIVGGWARVQLVSEDAFVQTFAPLAEDADVQDFIIDQTTTVILATVDVDQTTADFFDGLESLDLPDRAKAALQKMEGPAAAGAKSLIERGVENTIRSDAFPTVWRTTLVASHRAMVAAATLDDKGAVVLDANGSLGVNLGPIVAAVKQRLIDQGVTFAQAIPAVDRVVVIAQADGLLLIGTVYALANTVGFVLPWVTLALLIAGVLIARRRAAGVLGAGLAIAIGAGGLAAGIGGGGAFLTTTAPRWGVPAATMSAIFTAVAGAMQDSAIALTVLGVLIAVAGWLSGRSRAARGVRGVGASFVGSARDALQTHGMDTGRFGEWLYAQRVLVDSLIVLGGLLWLMALRPLSTSDVLGVVACGLAAAGLIALLGKPTRDDADAPQAADPKARPEAS